MPLGAVEVGSMTRALPGDGANRAALALEPLSLIPAISGGTALHWELARGPGPE